MDSVPPIPDTTSSNPPQESVNNLVSDNPITDDKMSVESTADNAEPSCSVAEVPAAETPIADTTSSNPPQESVNNLVSDNPITDDKMSVESTADNAEPSCSAAEVPPAETPIPDATSSNPPQESVNNLESDNPIADDKMSVESTADNAEPDCSAAEVPAAETPIADMPVSAVDQPQPPVAEAAALTVALSDQAADTECKPENQQVLDPEATPAEDCSPTAKEELRRRNRRLLTLVAGLVLVLALLAYLFVYISSGGKQYAAVAFPDTQSIAIVDIGQGRVIKNIKLAEGPECVAFSNTADRLFVGNREDNKVTVYSLPGMTAAGSFTTKVHATSIDHNASTPGRLVMQHQDGSQRYYVLASALSSRQVQEGQIIPRPKLRVAKMHGNFSPKEDTNADQEINIVFKPELQEVIAARGSDGKPITTIAVGKSPVDLGWNKEHTMCFVVVNGDSCVAVIDPKALRVTNKIPVVSRPHGFYQPYNSDVAVIVSEDDMAIVIFDLQKQRVVHQINFDSKPSNVQIWPREAVVPANSNEHRTGDNSRRDDQGQPNNQAPQAQQHRHNP